MDKRVTLAVAGAGKTFKICNHLDENKSNLVIAFTHRNIRNIVGELIVRFGKVPKYTYVKTFDSFLLSHFIKPYFALVREHFNEMNMSFEGVTMKTPQPQTIDGYPNPYYIKDCKIGHYIENGLIYCDRFAELIVKVKNKKYNLLNTALMGINKFYDNIYIDEFQDFRKHDYEVLENIIKKCNNIMLVGDYFQHSISGKNNSGKPFSNTDFAGYIQLLQKQGLLVDQKELIKSRRCSKEVCDFVRRRLGIDIYSEEINKGKVTFIYDETKLREIIENDQIVKLVVKNSKAFNFNALNWSYSKGDTIDTTCVILSENFENFDEDNFDFTKIKAITKNEIYVALTRTKSDLYIVKKSLFDKIKKDYQKESDKNKEDNHTKKEILQNNIWQKKNSKNGNTYYEKKYKKEIIRIFPIKYNKYSLAKYKDSGYYDQKFDTMEAAEEFFVSKVKEQIKT